MMVHNNICVVVYSTDEQHKVRNPYRWLAWKEEREKKDRRRMGERRAESPSEVRQCGADSMEKTMSNVSLTYVAVKGKFLY